MYEADPDLDGSNAEVRFLACHIRAGEKGTGVTGRSRSKAVQISEFDKNFAVLERLMLYEARMIDGGYQRTSEFSEQIKKLIGKLFVIDPQRAAEEIPQAEKRVKRQRKLEKLNERRFRSPRGRLGRTPRFT